MSTRGDWFWIWPTLFRNSASVAVLHGGKELMSLVDCFRGRVSRS